MTGGIDWIGFGSFTYNVINFSDFLPPTPSVNMRNQGPPPDSNITLSRPDPATTFNFGKLHLLIIDIDVGKRNAQYLLSFET